MKGIKDLIDHLILALNKMVELISDLQDHLIDLEERVKTLEDKDDQDRKGWLGTGNRR